MTLQELIHHPLLSLPIQWKAQGYRSYDQAVNQITQEYLTLLEHLDDSEISGQAEYLGAISKRSLLQVVERFRNGINDCLNLYLYQGNPLLAAQALKDSFLYQSDLPRAEQPNFCIGTFPLYPRQFRISLLYPCDPWKIFHAPFELRHKVGSSRYSIPGYPTLYLANSVLTAYREMGSKPYDSVFISQFEFTAKDHHSEYLVDMMNRPASDSLGDIYRYLARWPLIMACNIRVNEPNDPFKAEYILPQMIYQWVKEKYKIGNRPIAGVLYPSTKMQKSDKDIQSYHANTAIPVKEVSIKGHCPVITRMFKWSSPLSFSVLLKQAEDKKVAVSPSSGLINKTYERYLQSDFGRIQEALERLPYHKQILA